MDINLRGGEREDFFENYELGQLSSVEGKGKYFVSRQNSKTAEYCVL